MENSSKPLNLENKAYYGNAPVEMEKESSEEDSDANSDDQQSQSEKDAMSSPEESPKIGEQPAAEGQACICQAEALIIDDNPFNIIPLDYLLRDSFGIHSHKVQSG